MHVEDHPRFAWRGLMMDVSRHFMPVETVERNLDAMAAVKLNVLHWHLSDDQGFRVESRLHPRLQLLGSDGLYYSQAQIRAIVAYARDRGIRIVPEFDIPGHSASWLPGYPSLASGKGPFDILRTFGTSLAVMDPARESTCHSFSRQLHRRDGGAVSGQVFSYRRRRGKSPAMGMNRRASKPSRRRTT